MFASDPNWGRISAAVGRAEVENLDVSGVSIRLGKLSLIESGELSASYSERQGKKQVDKTDIEISVELGREATLKLFGLQTFRMITFELMRSIVPSFQVFFHAARCSRNYQKPQSGSACRPRPPGSH